MKKLKELEELKQDTIEMIILLRDFDILQQVHQQLKSYSTPKFMQGVRPIRENISFEQILAEQNYRPLSYQDFREQAKELGEDTPIEELLYSLSA
jgi:trehalose-6-phosphate synthase